MSFKQSSTKINLADSFTDQLELILSENEQCIISVCLDLDHSQNFSNTLLVLTNKRFLYLSNSGLEDQWDSTTELNLKSTMHAGLGTIHLSSNEENLQTWYFSAVKQKEVDAFIDAFGISIKVTQGIDHKDQVLNQLIQCPSCGVSLSKENPVCLECKPTAAPPSSQSLLRLLPFAKKRASTIIIGALLTIGSTSAALVTPYLTIPLLDDVLIPLQSGKEVNHYLIYFYLGGMALSSLIAWVLSWGKTYVIALAGEQISSDLRNTTFEHLQGLSLEYYGGKRTGDLISRISNDTDRICHFLSIHLIDFSSDILMIIMTSIVLLSIDPQLAVVTLLPLPAIIWLVQKVRDRLRHGFARASNAWAEMVNVLTDAIPGVRVVKAFAQEKREIERFQEVNQHVLKSNLQVNQLWSFFGPTIALLTDFGVLTVWAFGLWQVSQGNVTIGVLTAFLAYISKFYLRLDSMSRMLANAQRAAAATFRIFEILDRKATVCEPISPIHPGKLQGEIKIQEVSFKYDTRKILDQINLDIYPGELIGLVGPSGSGKSTLVNLVCRFFDVSQGNILIDGHNVKSFPIEEYRQNIGMVLQDPFLFCGTIAENIAYGQPDASKLQIIAASKAAHAHEFICKLPDGYDSLVGERGQSLSGGERQRISIARAILTDPSILILDEATSAVDNETEREIQAALENLIHGRTTIAIAHRLTTLRNANRIVVLENGKIVESGSHEELIESDGLYQRLCFNDLETEEIVEV